MPTTPTFHNCSCGHPYLRVLRGILLKDVGMDALWRDTLVLGAFAVVLLAFGVRRFQKNIE